MYKAIKNFSVNGNDYKVGDNVPQKDVEARLIRGRKIEQNFTDPDATVIEPIQEPEDITEETEELLTELSEEIEVEVEEDE